MRPAFGARSSNGFRALDDCVAILGKQIALPNQIDR